MAYIVDDRIAETTASTGTGNLTLGGAVTAYKAFSAVCANNDTFPYLVAAVDANGNPTGEWETGIGTYVSATPAIARTTVKKSSNANAAVSFSAGTKRVYLAYITDANLIFDGIIKALRLKSVAFAAITTPIAGEANFFQDDRIDLPGIVDEDGLVNVLSPDYMTSRIAALIPSINVTTITAIGVPSASVGSVTIRNPATTNYFTRRYRVGIVSVASAGSFSEWRMNGNAVAFGDSANPSFGGFRANLLFGCSDPASVSGARQICGIRGNAAYTNVEPSTLTNIVGVGNGAADTNLKLFYGGSAAQTPINLGANFPANTLSTDWYRVTIVSPRDKHLVCRVTVERLNTGHRFDQILTAASAGVQLPAAGSLSTLSIARTNNATPLQVALDGGLLLARAPW